MSNFDTYAVPEAIVLFVAAVVMMFSLNIWLALSMLVIVPVVILTAYRQSREIKPAFRNVRDQFSHLNSVCEEAIGGNRVIKAFAREKYEIEKFTEANESFYRSNTNKASIWAKYFPVLETCAAVLPFVSMLLGSTLVIWRQMKPSQLVTFNCCKKVSTGYLRDARLSLSRTGSAQSATPTRIMVVDRGNIQESGTYDELMAMKGEYYRLYISQYAGENI